LDMLLRPWIRCFTIIISAYGGFEQAVNSVVRSQRNNRKTRKWTTQKQTNLLYLLENTFNRKRISTNFNLSPTLTQTLTLTLTLTMNPDATANFQTQTLTLTQT